jgi:hypothetical protein
LIFISDHVYFNVLHTVKIKKAVYRQPSISK